MASNRAQSVIKGDNAVTEAGRRGLERKNAPKVFLEGQELPLRQAFGHMSFKTCKVNCNRCAHFLKHPPMNEESLLEDFFPYHFFILAFGMASFPGRSYRYSS